MALVPRERSSLLEKLELPESELYEPLYRLTRALHVHDREAAMVECKVMADRVPGHRLAICAERAIARYDADWAAALRGIDQLLESYPQDPTLEFQKLWYLRELARGEEHLPPPILFKVTAIIVRSPTSSLIGNDCW